MSFVVGQVVRPAYGYLRRTGVLCDFNGLLSAQGRVASVIAPAGIVSPFVYWDPNTSQEWNPSAFATGYSVKIWNMETRAFETWVYPEGELAAGTVNGAAIADLIVDPASNEAAANLVRSRL